MGKIRKRLLVLQVFVTVTTVSLGGTWLLAHESIPISLVAGALALLLGGGVLVVNWWPYKARGEEQDEAE